MADIAALHMDAGKLKEAKEMVRAFLEDYEKSEFKDDSPTSVDTLVEVQFSNTTRTAIRKGFKVQFQRKSLFQLVYKKHDRDLEQVKPEGILETRRGRS